MSTRRLTSTTSWVLLTWLSTDCRVEKQVVNLVRFQMKKCQPDSASGKKVARFFTVQQTRHRKPQYLEPLLRLRHNKAER